MKVQSAVYFQTPLHPASAREVWHLGGNRECAGLLKYTKFLYTFPNKSVVKWLLLEVLSFVEKIKDYTS